MARWHALWLKPDLAPDVEREVNIERVRTMGRQQALSAAAHTLNAGVLAIAAWPFLPHPALIGAVLLFLAAAASQLSTWWQHRHRGRPSAVSDRTISKVVFWSLGFGGLWGALTVGVLLGVPGHQIDLLTCMVIVGMASGGVSERENRPARYVG